MFVSYLRSCPGCGNSFGSVQWFCDVCLHQLLRYMKPGRRFIDPHIQHFYLFEWGDEALIRIAAHSIKGGRPPWAYDFLAGFFPSRSIGLKPLFYPSRGVPDHASLLAQSLAQRWEGQAISILKKSSRKQALLGRENRREVQFYPFQSSYSQCEMVDDIVTTGATAKALSEAVGRPEKMTVWSLFYRKSLSSER